MDSDYSDETMVNSGRQTWSKLAAITSRLKSLVSPASLKALYSHVGAVFQSLLRIHGLDVITFLYLRFRRGLNEEPPKVLLQSSFWLALARCTIHIIPALVSIGLVILNCRGYFIGNELEGPMNQDDMKLGLLQVAAKVQELLIVASVGSVIFHILRSELVFGEGIPLGLLTSGWNFSQIQYFWSAEFLGCLTRDRAMSPKQQCKRYGTLVFIAISGLLALVAGPAAAVLMIPRRKDWPVGGGIYWLNGETNSLTSSTR
ncbi:hypothetical protein CEP53_007258 [Fusarium sp. AF-6]|nr:hypothetical protein CEP53_007258 [Fusarium sp. AF-6]